MARVLGDDYQHQLAESIVGIMCHECRNAPCYKSTTTTPSRRVSVSCHVGLVSTTWNTAHQSLDTTKGLFLGCITDHDIADSIRTRGIPISKIGTGVMPATTAPGARDDDKKRAANQFGRASRGTVRLWRLARQIRLWANHTIHAFRSIELPPWVACDMIVAASRPILLIRVSFAIANLQNSRRNRLLAKFVSVIHQRHIYPWGAL